MREAIREWRKKRDLRKLGKVDVLESLKFQKRNQHDCLPWMIQVEFSAVTWITAKRKMPKILGRLR